MNRFAAVLFRALVQIGSVNSRTRRGVAASAALIVMLAAAPETQTPQSTSLIITLTGQSMVRSDIRVTAPKAVPVIQGLLKGDAVFTNLEAAVALPGQAVSEGRGFLTPPETLEALKTFGFNLLSLSNNHAFDMQATGIQNTIREAERHGMIHAGIGTNLDEAAAPAYLRKTPEGRHRAGFERIRSHRAWRDGRRRPARCQRTSRQSGRSRQRGVSRPSRSTAECAEPGGRRTNPGRASGRRDEEARKPISSSSSISTITSSEIDRSRRSSPRGWPNGWPPTTG